MKLYEPFQFLTTEECDELIAYAQQHTQAGTTLGKSNIRNNRVAWYKDSKYWNKWLSMFNNMDPVIDWLQTPQVAFYKPGEHYDWHVDTWPSFRTHIRYFTLVCELQTATGGKLQLETKDFDLSRGQAVIFKPSDRHRAVSPSDGERISLTIWPMSKNANKVDIS